jgi:(1->4)-alpha-D-glucan 1-alpha-D-glucosylmutase
MNSAFGFQDAASIVPYLHRLGIGDCYCSPILMAKPGSLHGYDVTDHSKLNPELGTEDDLAAFAASLHENGMGMILDVVPNHMCITDPSNTGWWDVLENGPSSSHSARFDIDWRPPKEELWNKVLLPILGDQYGQVLENGGIRIVYDRSNFYALYYDHRLPLAPRSWPAILEPALVLLRDRVGPEHEATLELESILTAISYLPPRHETDEEKIRERLREKEILKRRISTLASSIGDAGKAIDESIERINGSLSDPRSFDAMDRLLDDQAYRVAYWRVAADEINYRRFFDINELAAIRVEDPDIFQLVHARICQLIEKGWVQGLRIDHPDGLYEPARYFEQLQKLCCQSRPDGPSFYVVAEKILASDEHLRPWAIQGTTGYGFLNYLNGIFVDRSRARAFYRLYSSFTDVNEPIDEIVYDSKRLILQVSLSSELNVLARRLDRISEQHRWSRDFTLENLRDALREVITCFPIYRTYLANDATAVDPEDERHVRTAFATAKRRNAAMSMSVFDFIQDLFLLRDPPGLSEEQIRERRHFVLRVQQFTGPVMAKGLEDTAFYRHYPLASLNEVGANHHAFGHSASYLHNKNRIRLARWPHALAPTSTHDTKRGEDVRARINVLSEIPVEWYRAIRAWHEMNRGLRTDVQGTPAPTRNEEYLLYQTLTGTWPLEPMNLEEHQNYLGRIDEYLRKALREAKVNTSWIRPNEEHEKATSRFLEGLLQSTPENSFLSSFVQFQEPVARAGVLNSLSQVAIKAACPGVPDFYQGTDLWAFTLVDPDNRRPVDYEKRIRMLDAIDEEEANGQASLVERLLESPARGEIKLYVTSRILRFRRRHPDLFAKGSYLPLVVSGARQNHVFAFARQLRRKTLIVAAGRFFYHMLRNRWPLPASEWADTNLRLSAALARGRYRDVLTGNRVNPAAPGMKLEEVFTHLPVAVLESE